MFPQLNQRLFSEKKKKKHENAIREEKNVEKIP